MVFYVIWHADTDRPIDLATKLDHPDDVRQVGHDLEAGARIWESWALRTGGTTILSSGPSGQIEVPGDSLVDLPDLREQYRAAVDVPVSCGVGAKLSEANVALEVAQKRGGDRIVLYTPDIRDELEGSSQHGDDKLAGIMDEIEAIENSPDAPEIAKAQPQAPQGPAVNQPSPSPGEATAIQRGDASPTAAEPSAPQSASAGPASQQADQGEAQQADPLKQSIVRVLQEAKKLAPMLDEIKSKNPELYDVINGSVANMIEMARQLYGQAQGQEVQKSEELDKMGLGDIQGLTQAIPQDAVEHAKVMGKQLVALHGPKIKALADAVTSKLRARLGKPAVVKGEELDKAAPPATHHLMLPPGTVKDGRIKVVHGDNKTSWLSVRSGQVMSNDSTEHGISAKNPNGR